MSFFVARITDIQCVDNLHIVTFDFQGIALTMMSLDLNADMMIGTRVHLAVKPTHIALAKDFSGIVSYSNLIKSKIISIDNGALLSSVELLVAGITLESIVTKASALRMNLQMGDEVTIMIKASELSITEVLDD